MKQLYSALCLSPPSHNMSTLIFVSVNTWMVGGEMQKWNMGDSLVRKSNRSSVTFKIQFLLDSRELRLDSTFFAKKVKIKA